MAAASAAVYGVLCLVFFLLDVIVPPSTAVPRWLVSVLVSLIGPTLLLTFGIGGLKIFLAALTSIAVCLAFSWFCWRRYRESEVFVLGLVVAAMIWVASGWLAVAFAH